MENAKATYKTILTANEESASEGLKLIQVNDGFVVVDLNVAIGGDNCWTNKGLFHKMLSNGLAVFKNFPNQEYSETAYNLDDCFKVIFATPDLKLEGVPLIEEKQDDEFDKLLLELDYCWSEWKIFEAGYRKAQQNLFTEEQVREAFNASDNYRYYQNNGSRNIPSDVLDEDDFIKFLKQPRVEITFENGVSVKAVMI